MSRRERRARVRYNLCRRQMWWVVGGARPGNRKLWRSAWPHYMYVADHVTRYWGHVRPRGLRVAPRGGLIFEAVDAAADLTPTDYGDDGPPVPLL